MVIVTQNQYLLASKIHHITLDEQLTYHDVRKSSGGYRSVQDLSYLITIIYSPENVTLNNGNTAIRSQEDHRECSVTIRTAKNAHKVFQDLITQIREQMPDELFLHKALERMLANTDLSELEKKDKETAMLNDIAAQMEKEKAYDRKSKAVRKSRKAKRANKDVLRTIKSSRGRR